MRNQFQIKSCSLIKPSYYNKSNNKSTYTNISKIGKLNRKNQLNGLYQYKCDRILKELQKMMKIYWNLPEKCLAIFKTLIENYIIVQQNSLNIRDINQIGKNLLTNGQFVILFTKIACIRNPPMEQNIKDQIFNLYHQKIRKHTKKFNKFFENKFNFAINHPNVSVRTPKSKHNKNVPKPNLSPTDNSLKRSASKYSPYSPSMKKIITMSYQKYAQLKGIKIEKSVAKKQNSLLQEIYSTQKNIKSQIKLSQKEKIIINILQIKKIFKIQDIKIFMILNKNFKNKSQIALCIVFEPHKLEIYPLLAIVNLQNFQQMTQKDLNQLKEIHDVSAYLKIFDEQSKLKFFQQNKNFNKCK